MKKSFFLMMVILLLLSACSQKVVREDPMTADEVTADWDIKDINIIAEAMVDSLRDHYLARQTPPAVIVVLDIKNKTYEHINTKAITETVVTALIKERRFRAIAERSRRADIQNERFYRDDVESDDVLSSENLRRYRHTIGADYVMYGEITGIEKRGSGVRDVSYKMTLKIVDVDTTIIEWQEQKDIRKKQKNSFLGL